MKTLIASALIAAAAFAPAVQAQQVGAGSLGAIAHFNQDHDGQDGRIALSSVSQNGTAVSTRAGTFGDVYDRFNADHDGQDNIRGQQGATLVSGIPAVAQNIFAAIREEGRDND